MDMIVDYLKNPMEIGIRHKKICVDFSDVLGYLQSLMDEYLKLYGSEKRRASSPFREERANNALTKMKEITPSDNYFDLLIETLSEFSHFPSFPEDLGPYFYRELPMRTIDGKPMLKPDGTQMTRHSYRPPPIHIFNSRIMISAKDVLTIDKNKVDGNRYIFDLVSIKENGINNFLQFLGMIPPLKDKITILKDVSHYSSRYVFRPYNYAVELWIEDEASTALPLDLKSILQGATKYISSGEWRTSIVLSAITTESILADIYEETFKKQAPDVPLGNLFQYVKDKIKLPQEIVSAIEATNEARIAAVHRSRFTVSNREAVNALYGATNLSVWYSQKY